MLSTKVPDDDDSNHRILSTKVQDEDDSHHSVDSEVLPMIIVKLMQSIWFHCRARNFAAQGFHPVSSLLLKAALFDIGRAQSPSQFEYVQYRGICREEDRNTQAQLVPDDMGDASKANNKGFVTHAAPHVLTLCDT